MQTKMILCLASCYVVLYALYTNYTAINPHWRQPRILFRDHEMCLQLPIVTFMKLLARCSFPLELIKVKTSCLLKWNQICSLTQTHNNALRAPCDYFIENTFLLNITEKISIRTKDHYFILLWRSYLNIMMNIYILINPLNFKYSAIALTENRFNESKQDLHNFRKEKRKWCFLIYWKFDKIGVTLENLTVKWSHYLLKLKDFFYLSSNITVSLCCVPYYGKWREIWSMSDTQVAYSSFHRRISENITIAFPYGRSVNDISIISLGFWLP